MISYILDASSFLVLSNISKTFTVNNLFPKRTSISSFTFKSVELFAKTPLTLMRPLSATSLATGRLLIMRETFKYLSHLIVSPLMYYCTIFLERA